jgi:predicted DNA-binding protein (MmcQ/YjbR family)
MNIESVREYCIAMKGVSESFPFDESTLVFKVMGKIFVLLSLEGDSTINVKCDPELAIQQREQYEAVKPGYHMNKKHWNTIDLNGVFPNGFIQGCINHSYDLVVKSLTKKLQNELINI